MRPLWPWDPEYRSEDWFAGEAKRVGVPIARWTPMEGEDKEEWDLYSPRGMFAEYAFIGGILFRDCPSGSRYMYHVLRLARTEDEQEPAACLGVPLGVGYLEVRVPFAHDGGWCGCYGRSPMEWQRISGSPRTRGK